MCGQTLRLLFVFTSFFSDVRIETMRALRATRRAAMPPTRHFASSTLLHENLPLNIDTLIKLVESDDADAVEAL